MMHWTLKTPPMQKKFEKNIFLPSLIRVKIIHLICSKGNLLMTSFYLFIYYNLSFRADRKTKPIVFVFNKHVLHFESKLNDVIVYGDVIFATCFFKAIRIENPEMTEMINSV